MVIHGTSDTSKKKGIGQLPSFQFLYSTMIASCPSQAVYSAVLLHIGSEVLYTHTHPSQICHRDPTSTALTDDLGILLSFH